MSAANPVFSLLERIGYSTTLPPVDVIRKNIEHEMLAFQSRLFQKNYTEEFISLANYLLSATVDELIGKNYLRIFQASVEFKAFTPLSVENKSPQTLFFEIVNHLKEKANQYLDLIELAYYCLITGFEGEKRLLSDGRNALDNLIEELYQLINLHRVNKYTEPLKEKKVMAIEKNISYKPIIITIVALIGITISIFSLSQLWIESKAKSILQEHPIFANKLENK